MEGLGRKFLQGERRVCLDSSAVIAIVKCHPLAEALLQALHGRKVFLPSVAVFELLLRRTNLDVMEDFIAEARKVLPFDAEAAKIASQLDKSLKQKGMTIEWRDLFIAATAIANNCELATLNRKDFEKIEGLKLLDF